MNPRLGLRLPTMTRALELLEERGGTRIVETGCARQADNWEGDGQSSVVFGEWAQEHGHLWTVDADPGNLDTCRRLTWEWQGSITYALDDSVHFLTEHREPIDLLYLDSFDYPLLELVNLYGSEADFRATVERLHELGDDYLVEQHADIIEDCQRHCEREIRAALPLLHDRSIVLIDDANLPGGGKARLARKVLAGWTCVMDEYQALWSKT